MSTMREEAASATSPAGRWPRVRVHLRVAAIAAVFGLGAYAVVRLLIVLTRHLGWLDWLHS